jgi:hypothetical protein
VDSKGLYVQDTSKLFDSLRSVPCLLTCQFVHQFEELYTASLFIHNILRVRQ